jgi:hypothetical protein
LAVFHEVDAGSSEVEEGVKRAGGVLAWLKSVGSQGGDETAAVAELRS